MMYDLEAQLESTMQDAEPVLYVKNNEVVIVSHAARLIQRQPDGETLVWNNNVASLHRVIEVLTTPKSLTAAAEDTGLSIHEVEHLIHILLKAGVLVTYHDRSQDDRMLTPLKRACERMILGISGSVQAACILQLAVLIKRFFANKVEIVLTKGGSQFVSARVFEHFGFSVWQRVFETRGSVNAPHIHLASADLIAIIPASANTIHRLATGECSDLLSLAVAATKAPVVIAPSMNGTMFEASCIKRNIARLRSDGCYIIEPHLAREVSGGTFDERGPGGIGINEGNIISVLTSILRVHAGSTELAHNNEGNDVGDQAVPQTICQGPYA